MTVEAEGEQRVLHPGAGADIVDDQRPLAVRRHPVGDDGDVRQVARQALRHQIARMVGLRIVDDIQRRALAPEEGLQIGNAAMVDVAVRLLAAQIFG